MTPAHRPRKRFGQHFLADQTIVEGIVGAISPQPGDRMIEIGPGQGALTIPLLKCIAHLDVIELDRDLVAELRQRFRPEQLTVHSADALEFDFGSLGNDLRIVGNLPYNISTPLLFHLTHYAHCVRDLHFMLQKEVVERMVAAPSTADYGRLSVMLQDRFDMQSLFEVPPEAFRPPPKVDSAVVRMRPLSAAERRARGASHDAAAFARVVTAAFGMRRKTLRNSLAGVVDAEILKRLGIDPGARAENLSPGDFARIAAHGGSPEVP
ncbi:MAG TPA: 16S rRNA (adenine(1518)-N(6)/adenine(1519)-N(6))-dimethyltransferase RsmA [Burkholderiales bacterium]|nr:16S rRNA (adenine(1518)-N(6)/adenine(1519)-N(6))-dimethyltransferase RsmA [Burkholderiales bacterium]